MDTEETRREQGHMKTKAEIGVMQLQASNAKECLAQPEAAGGRKDSPLKHSEEVWLC